MTRSSRLDRSGLQCNRSVVRRGGRDSSWAFLLKISKKVHYPIIDITMWRFLWIFTRAFFLSLIFLLLMDVTESVNRRPKHHRGVEGRRCELSNGGGRGKCVKTINCPEKLAEIRKGRYNALDRCGFLERDEIVCCKVKRRHHKRKPKNTKRRLRRADAACINHHEEMLHNQDLTLFFTVIFNGVSANLGEFPHMAALGYAVSKEEASEGRIYVCGGTLISKKHVLTAAHCVSNVDNLVPVEVLLGVTDLVGKDKSQMQRISISKITKHPQYRRSFHYHDIAVLELDDRVKITAYVMPTCLMTKPASEENATPELVVLGWGGVDIDGTLSSKLLKATKLEYVRTTECSKTYSQARAKLPRGLDEGMICVRDPNITRKADTCWGDSGGPLLGSSRPFSPLVGVTSFGVACGGGLPAVYTSVYKHLNWIEDQVWPKEN